jgi:hypothetical protein
VLVFNHWGGCPTYTSVEDILADWEIEEESVTVTRSQALRAVDACYGNREIFLKNMGFKE